VRRDKFICEVSKQQAGLPKYCFKFNGGQAGKEIEDEEHICTLYCKQER
jgi:hypothetical protein